jgi:hypothetical protein
MNRPKGSTDLLTNFFHEAISRVVPGLVFLALYEHKHLIAAFKAFGDSSIIFGLSILVAAWVVGLTIDIVSYIPVALIEWFDKKYYQESILEEEPDSDDEKKWIHYMKNKAQTVLFRSMFLISGFTLFVHPPLLLVVMPPVCSEGKWQCIITCIITFLFLFAYLRIKKLKTSTK